MSIQPRGEPRSVVIPRLEVELGRLAPGPDQLGVLLVHAVGGGRVGQVRDQGQQLVALARGVGQFGRGLASSSRSWRNWLDLLGPGGCPWTTSSARRAAPRPARSADASGRRRPAAHRSHGPLRAWPARPGSVSGFLPGGLEVDHLRESSGELARRRDDANGLGIAGRAGAPARRRAGIERGGGPGRRRRARVASTEPPRISANAPPIAGVNRSPSTETPEDDGDGRVDVGDHGGPGRARPPRSARKNSRNATAVQTTASPARAASTRPGRHG